MIEHGGQRIFDGSKASRFLAFAIRRRMWKGNETCTSRLGHKDSISIQPFRHELVEFLCVQCHGRSGLNGIAHVNNHNIKLVVDTFEVLLHVADDIFHFGMVRHRLPAPFWQVLLGNFNDLRIDVHHDNAIYSIVPQDLAGRGELSSASNKDALGRCALGEDGRPKERGMDQALVIHELIMFRTLRLAIRHERPTKVRIDDLYLLKFAEGCVMYRI
mmetsp:Transcript_30133/g.51292  ORF Transcript_30133/g.51292 Transcript_30133/m.51292 type:complete len:216 (+) Transcript_30133:601-1248(+)